jgi:hypothetical protein
MLFVVHWLENGGPIAWFLRWPTYMNLNRGSVKLLNQLFQRSRGVWTDIDYPLDVCRVTKEVRVHIYRKFSLRFDVSNQYA